MGRKFRVGDEVAIPTLPGYTGTVIMIDVEDGYCLLDCHPGAVDGYVWYEVPKGVLPYDGRLAGNWFHEDSLCPLKEATK